MASKASPPESTIETLAAGASVQANVVGALLLREIHTRYGRNNVGYLWMFAEPLLLALAVATLHGFHASTMAQGSAIHPVPFAIGGYTTFIIFRGIIGRSESTIEANAPLLYHSRVTLFDMLLARASLEGIGVSTAQFALLACCWAVGFGGPPARPLILIFGLAGFTWFSFALSMLVCAGTYHSRVLEKLIHPLIYILMPISGAFFALKSVPEPFRDWLSWVPLTQFFEMVHAGQFESLDLRFVHPVYLIGCNMALTYLGMVALRVIRRQIHLS